MLAHSVSYLHTSHTNTLISKAAENLALGCYCAMDGHVKYKYSLHQKIIQNINLPPYQEITKRLGTNLLYTRQLPIPYAMQSSATNYQVQKEVENLASEKYSPRGLARIFSASL